MAKNDFHGKRFTEYSKILIKYTVLNHLGAIKSNDITNNSDLSEHWDKCRDELQEMQNEKIGNSNVLLYQFLFETNENKWRGLFI